MLLFYSFFFLLLSFFTLVWPVNLKINYRHSSNSCVLSGDNEAWHSCGASQERHSCCFIFRLHMGLYYTNSRMKMLILCYPILQYYRIIEWVRLERTTVGLCPFDNLPSGAYIDCIYTSCQEPAVFPCGQEGQWYPGVH